MLGTTDEEEAVAVGELKEEGPDELMEGEKELADANPEPDDTEERPVEVAVAIVDAT
jgi:hypothetical protein